jgi:hypothetical protein
MKEEQCKTAAEGFLRALKGRQELRDRWVDLARNKDWHGVRELIAGTLELDETPSEEDLAKMDSHANRHLTGKRKELEELDERIDSTFVFNGRHGPPFDD